MTHRRCTGQSAFAMPTIEEIAERVERLLLRHEELKRTNALLQAQLATVTAERDSLRSRLAAARSRIDALLERLPADGESEGSTR
jgi:cell division protein ZapB